MKMMTIKNKTLLCFLLMAALLPFRGVAAYAAEEQAPPTVNAAEAASDPDEELTHLMDAEELESFLRGFIAERGIQEGNFSFAFCYTGTGETYYYNPDQYLNAASLYKLSLMMGLARKVSSGELQQTDSIVGMDISYIERRSLTYSDNEVSEAVIGYFFPFRSYRLMQAEIAGIPESELPEEYFSSNTFSARFMMGVLKELYQNPEKYPNVLECLRDANPGEYFRLSMDGQYDVAQKYGGGDGWLHTAGIIYTPTPILLVVMTYHVTNAERAIADLAQAMAERSLAYDAKREAILAERAEAVRLAEEAAAREEQERLDREREERERLAAEEEARRQAEEEARRLAEQAESTPEPTPTSEPRNEVLPVNTTAQGILVAALAAALVLVSIIALIRRRR